MILRRTTGEDDIIAAITNEWCYKPNRALPRKLWRGSAFALHPRHWRKPLLLAELYRTLGKRLSTNSDRSQRVWKISQTQRHKILNAGSGGINTSVYSETRPEELDAGRKFFGRRAIAAGHNHLNGNRRPGAVEVDHSDRCRRIQGIHSFLFEIAISANPEPACLPFTQPSYRRQSSAHGLLRSKQNYRRTDRGLRGTAFRARRASRLFGNRPTACPAELRRVGREIQRDQSTDATHLGQAGQDHSAQSRRAAGSRHS